MKVGDLVRMNGTPLDFWGVGILVREMEFFDGWDVYWSNRKSCSFHASNHLEVINERR